MHVPHEVPIVIGGSDLETQLDWLGVTRVG
jgi:hypothetical protein